MAKVNDPMQKSMKPTEMNTTRNIVNQTGDRSIQSEAMDLSEYATDDQEREQLQYVESHKG